MSYGSAIRCSRLVRGAAISLKAPASRVSVKARAVKKVTRDEFNAALENPKPLVVEIFTEWSGPCQTFGPVFAEVADIMSDSVNCVRVDMDTYFDIAAKYGVSEVPAILIFKGGKRVYMNVGQIRKAVLMEEIESNIA